MSLPDPEIDAQLQALARAITRANTFTLLIAVCDSASDREKLIGRVHELVPEMRPGSVEIDTHKLFLDEVARAGESADFLNVYGLERDLADEQTRRKFTRELNASRPRWRERVPKPVVFWVSESFLTVLEQDAPDFYNWRGDIFFLNPAVNVTATAVSVGQVTTVITRRSSEFDRELAIERRAARIRNLKQRLSSASPESSFHQRGRWLQEVGELLMESGDLSSGADYLHRAVQAHKQALVERKREQRPLEWAMTQNDLGNALWTLGQRENGTSYLEEAGAAFREALKEYTQERVPLEWAMTQNNLGNVLRCLGERESGTSRLELAVDAFREALKEYTRERAPQDWAMIQNNLGVALFNLGQREDDTERLGQAVVAFRNALKERTRVRAPLQWAATKNNLGAALLDLSRYENSTHSVELAVESYLEALQEYTQDRVPLDWAMTQHNLGIALRTLGLRERGTARLEQAVQAYQQALRERTRERVPLDWAMTQSNLGAVWETWGHKENSVARWREALLAYRTALEVFEEGGASYFIDHVKRNIARVVAKIATHGGGE